MLLGFIAARGGANDIAKVMDHFRLLFGTGTQTRSSSSRTAKVPVVTGTSSFAGVSQEQTDWHHCRT